MWDGDPPLDDDRAGSTYDELCKRYLDSDDVLVPPAPRIVAYVEALVARYPDANDPDFVWSAPPVIDGASGPTVYLTMAYGAVLKACGSASGCTRRAYLPE
ncbi:hypothetical protein AB0D33_36280 [Streptomyces sp. NPDC048404]|uniref:hypothetical protein n=1 Tax=unclassified Streptomyces TaxID=2593676 RepID=UPI00341F81BC